MATQAKPKPARRKHAHGSNPEARGGRAIENATTPVDVAIPSPAGRDELDEHAG